MATGKPKFYWDTAPLIAWFTDEKRKKSEMDGLADVIEMVDRNDAVLMISVLWRAEVVDLDLSKPKRQRIEEEIDGRSFIELSIDGRILDLASEIRRYHKSSKKAGTLKNIRTPDAIHLATAIHYDATEFHTFDGERPGKNPAGLISLSGNVAGHKLKICAPQASQLRLDFPNSNEVDDQ